MRERGREQLSYAGHLLLAHPSLRDPNFRRTVLLMSAHDAAGAVGVVLNRPTGRVLGRVDAAFAGTPLEAVPVYHGGPVETEKLILTAWQVRLQEEDFQLSFGLEPERAEALLATPGVTVRAFLGYAGWSAGQLEGEMRQSTWFPASVADYNLTAAEGVMLWRMILGSLDPQLKLLADEPDEPGLN